MKKKLENQVFDLVVENIFLVWVVNLTFGYK